MSSGWKTVMADPNKPLALILAGGSGTRFWPYSSTEHPKQFLKLVGKDSLFRQAVDRIQPLTGWENLFVCTLQSHQSLAQAQAPEIQNWILEPTGKNTAPCILLSVLQLLKRDYPKETPLIVLPADHFVGNPEYLRGLFEKAASHCQKNQSLITFGIVPKFAETGFGYIQVEKKTARTEEITRVQKFLEKPEKAVAEKLLQEGNVFWNSGMFVWTLETITKAFQQFMPLEWKTLSDALRNNTLSQAYEAIKPSPIDIAILEKASQVYTMPASLEWSDLGSWNAVYQLKSKNGMDNVVLSGNLRNLDSEGCLVSAPDREVALIGVKDLIVTEHEGKILVAHRSQDQRVKELGKTKKPS